MEKEDILEMRDAKLILKSHKGAVFLRSMLQFRFVSHFKCFVSQNTKQSFACESQFRETQNFVKQGEFCSKNTKLNLHEIREIFLRKKFECQPLT